MPLWCYGGEGDAQVGGVNVAPLQGAMVVCYAGGGEGDGQLWGSEDVVPLWCAMVGGKGDGHLWGSGRGAIAGGHCRVLL